MSEASYEVRFSGTVAEGADPDTVKTRMAALFKVEPGRIERLFSGRTVVLKRGLDPETALKYRAAMARIGAIVELAHSLEADPQGPATPEAGPRAGSGGSMTLAEPGVLLTESRPRLEPDIDISGLSMAEAGIDLVTHEPAEPARIDTERLSLAEPGVDLVEPGDRREPEIDISGLSAAPPGETLSQGRRPPPPEIDISDLDID